MQIEGAKGFLIRPANSNSGLHEWVWFAPVVFSKDLPNKRQLYIFSELVKRGLWIAGIDVGESYGNSAGVIAYNRFYDQAVKQFNLSPLPSLLCQSRGALMLFNWAIKYPTRLKRIGGIYPVLNLSSWPMPDDALFPEAALAYGMSREEFEKQSLSLSPMSHLKDLAENHIPILCLHGDRDRWVPLTQNSAMLAENYSRLGGSAKVVIVRGKGHEEADDFFRSDILIEFLAQP
jgi:pimeloyl-ACP methyl ester carboxylesterase